MLNFKSVDVHVCGLPVRVVYEGHPYVPGKTMLEKFNNAPEYLDAYRVCVCTKVRGFHGMYCAFITEAVSPDCTFGVIEGNSVDYCSMCGDAMLAVIRASYEIEGLIPDVREGWNILNIDSVNEIIRARVLIENGKVQKVCFCNQPSFVAARRVPFEVPGYGILYIDICWTGTWMSYIHMEDLPNLKIDTDHIDAFIDLAKAWQKVFYDQVPTIVHPDVPEFTTKRHATPLCFITEPIRESDIVHINIFCQYADTWAPSSGGTSTSGIAALLYEDGILKEGDRLVNNCLTGHPMECEVVGTAKIGNYNAVIPELSEKTFLMSRTNFLLEDEDPFPDGFPY